MRHVFTRQQLHDLIWERAVSKVAPELGISDVALRKRCIAHAIPLPGATYWGRRNAGRSVKRTSLPSLPKGVSDRIVINGHSESEAPAAVVAAIAEARAHVPVAVDVPVKGRLVTATMKMARKAKPDREWGAVTGLGSDCFQVSAHPAALDRLEGFLAVFVAAVRARGWRLTLGKDGVEVVVEDEAMSFLITQTIRRVRHVATADEQRMLDRWDKRQGDDWGGWRDRPVLPWWDCTPTGEMRLEIQSWPYVDGVARRFADTRNRKLEDRIDDILVSFAAHAAARKVERVRAVERQRQEELARLERARLERLAKLEHARVEWLERKLAEQRAVEALRRFVEHLDADIVGAGWTTMREWADLRLAAAEARLAPSALSAEVETMEAFAEPTG